MDHCEAAAGVGSSKADERSCCEFSWLALYSLGILTIDISSQDVALGADGSLILCTESGHVFVRTRNPKAGANDGRRQAQTAPPSNHNANLFKFQRVPYLQRIVKVCTNSTGAFAALRMGVPPRPILRSGNGISEDMRHIRPFVLPDVREEVFWDLENGQRTTCIPSSIEGTVNAPDEDMDRDEETEIQSIIQDVAHGKRII